MTCHKCAQKGKREGWREGEREEEDREAEREREKKREKNKREEKMPPPNGPVTASEATEVSRTALKSLLLSFMSLELCI